MKLGEILTIVVVIVAVLSISVFVAESYIQNSYRYEKISYSISRTAPRFDYSCNEEVYGMHVSLSNNGTKEVQDLSVAISNPICVGAVPSIPEVFSPGQSFQFYLYSANQNGTITITGNNTFLMIRF